MKLTEKQKQWAKEFLVDFNATQAAIRAGYSETSAHTVGYKNANNDKIKEYITELMEDKKKERDIADLDEVLKYLTRVVRAEEIVENEKAVRNGKVKIKEKPSFKDRNKAAELLGKRYGAFTDNIELNMKDKVVIYDDIPGDAEDED